MKDDEEAVECRVWELDVVHLVPAADSTGLQAVELCTFIDPSPVSERARVALEKREARKDKPCVPWPNH